MAEAAPSYEEHQEFWKPAGFPRLESLPTGVSEHTCLQCKSDLIAGAQFCHKCGAERHPDLDASARTSLFTWQSLLAIRDALGQSTASFAALILGGACLVAALLTGFIFTASSLLDWQAIQLWRIEWLLAAIAVFAAGILLQKAR